MNSLKNSNRDFVIFLDIDGVLDGRLWFSSPFRKLWIKLHGWNKHSSEAIINPVNLHWVGKLCKKLNAKVVLSTSWRYAWGEDGNLLKDEEGNYRCSVVDKIFRKHGINIISKTGNYVETQLQPNEDVIIKTKNQNRVWGMDWGISNFNSSSINCFDDEGKEFLQSKEKVIHYYRGAQIAEWLQIHRDSNFNNFLILEDDYHDVWCFKDLKEHVIKTSFYKRLSGFRFKHYIESLRKAKKYLRNVK